MREDVLRIFVEIIFLAKSFLFFSFFLSREGCKDVMEPSHDGNVGHRLKRMIIMDARAAVKPLFGVMR